MTTTAKADTPSIPGPRTLPVIGPYWNFLRLYISPIPIIRDHYKKYGAVSLAAAVELDQGQRGAVFALAPEYNQYVLNNPGIFYSPGLGGKPGTPQERLTTGLVFMNGDPHKQHRRMVMPAFHKNYLDTYYNDMLTLTEQMLSSWQVGQTRDIANDMRQLTIRIANKTLFGLDKTAEQRSNLGEMIREWLALNVSPLVRLLPYNLPGLPYRRLMEVSERLEHSILALIAEKRAAGLTENDILSVLLQTNEEDGTKLTDTQVIGHVNIIFIAGHETSASVMAWVLFLLSQHPQIMADLLNELDAKLHGQPPRVDQLDDLPLLERVIKETMRLLPPMVFAQRDGIEEFNIGSYRLPAGSSVFVSHFMTHRLPEIYAEPDRFIPDRWLTINPSPYEYMPFSAGPRMCIGAGYAMMEMKLVLATLLQRYRLEIPPDARIDFVALPTLSLSPKHGLPMTIHNQDRQFTVNSVQGTIRQLVDLP